MPWAALMDRRTGPAAPAVTAASACCSQAHGSVVGGRRPQLARTALDPGSRGAAWGRWPPLGRIMHGLCGGRAGGSTSSQRRSSCRRASSRMLSPKYVPQPVDRWRWHSVSSTRAFESPSTCAAPARHSGQGGGAGAGPSALERAPPAASPGHFYAGGIQNRVRVRTGVCGLRGQRRARRRGAPEARVTPPHLQQAPGYHACCRPLRAGHSYANSLRQHILYG
jgi:hypothetical protein